jgi:hypothetical protein
MLLVKKCLTVAAAAAVGTALLIPVGVSTEANAAPAASSMIATQQPFTADNVTFAPGDRVTLTGTAAPGTQIGVLSLPGDPERTTTATADGTWSMTSTGTATERFSTIVGAYFEGGSYQRALSVTASPGEKVHTLRILSAFTYSKGQPISMHGEAVPGETLELTKRDGTLVRKIKVDAAGEWSFTTKKAYTAKSVQWNLRSQSGISVFELCGQ